MIERRWIAGVLLAGMIAATGSTAAFAAKNNDQQKTPNITSPSVDKPEAPDPDKLKQMQKRMDEALDKLVKDGTIKKEQKDAVKKAMEAAKDKPHGHRHGVLRDLVEDEILTREQAQAIRKAIRPEGCCKKKPE